MTGHRHCMVVHAQYPVGETRVQREALALQDRGIDVDVLCLRGPNEPAREVVDGVTVHRLPIGRHRGRGLAWQMVEYLVFFVLAGATLTARHLRRRYRTVQVHNLPDFLVFCALVPKLTGAGVLLDLHDLMPEFMAAKRGRRMGDPLVRLVAWQERLSCRFADRVITVTDTWRHTLAARSTSIEKVGVVMNLADPRFFAWTPRDRTEVRDTWRIVYHGTLTHRYGVDLLLQAAHDVTDEIPEIHVDLLGDGDAREELIALTAALGLDGKVSFSEGMLAVTALSQAICDADVGVVPNRDDVFTDGLLPTKLLEYVAIGTPVVAARTSGIRAEFDDASVAFFTPGDIGSLADCLRSLHRDRARLNQLSEAAAGFSAGHRWTTEADAYCALVREAGRRG
jgi:glycosyltransferase involved in cell wall biosynthesis